MRYYIAAEGKAEYLISPAGVPVIIDVLRASSTIIAALWKGAEKVIPVEYEDWALKLGKDIGAVLIGERDGVRLEGFDYNNSPNEILKADLKGKTVVMTTSNGTKVMVDGGIIASTLNAGAVANHIKDSDRTYLLASGSPLKSDEDMYTAMLIEKLIKKMEQGYSVDDALSLSSHEEDFISLLDSIRHSGSGKKVSHLGYADDVDMICTSVNKFPIIPVYRNGAIRLSYT
ncbi:2-phosphosulfolactate phosphatase [Methanocella sp. CWC-04]|uniref:2-phosphosulfolactate phosphatase n=1 Tax=Methanooceanicella nereidis TaxID=2052831 RepID=A0AAP2RCI1_9EURY|nr:2-phosphosulfolactate phosphatase [Methanocella sp. CWC-04]MCD1294803.1 2-phosphosulfolactate phosphatase [Methanocella sp. CWC-04]